MSVPPPMSIVVAAPSVRGCWSGSTSAMLIMCDSSISSCLEEGDEYGTHDSSGSCSLHVGHSQNLFIDPKNSSP